MMIKSDTGLSICLNTISYSVIPSKGVTNLNWILTIIPGGAFSTCTHGEVSPIFLAQNIAESDIFGSKED